MSFNRQSNQKTNAPKRFLLVLICFFVFSISTIPIKAQSEILTNADIIEMAQAGLGKELIAQKIKATGGNYDVTAKGLIALKKGGVDDEVIAVVVEKSKVQPETLSPFSGDKNAPVIENKTLAPADLLRSARTLAFFKDTINPSRQALEKELLKRPEWKKINLSITADKTTADLGVDIGFVPFSVITHRYVFRIYDRRSGLVIAAGEMTSWGSLAKNLAREIAKN